MRLPRLNVIQQSRQATTVFGGYNHNPVIGDGEWYDMRNMTSDHYPLLAPEMSGKATQAKSSILGMVSNNGLCYVRADDNNHCSFVITTADGTDITVGVELTYGKKKLVNMGAYVVILPDKKWVNVAAVLDENSTKAEKSGSIEASISNGGHFSFYVCTKDGEKIDFSASEDRPEAPADGDYWIDTAQSPPVLKQWYEAARMWMGQESYLRVFFGRQEGPSPFQKGDAIQAPAWTGEYETPDGVKKMYILENPLIQEVIVLEDGLYEYVVKGIAEYGDKTSGAEAEGDLVTWRRTMPDMDFIIESGNRLWGCKYGQTEDGFINEIYASKLGDFKNWNSFQGVSTDSYRASVGEDGRFTGAATYNGKPVFFKEDCMIQVYGAYPAQYQTNVIKCNGIRDGCAKSAAVVDNRLYYYSRNGVCMYDGSLPVIISEPLGKLTDKEVLGGGAGSKYYLLGDGGRCYVFDAMRGMWHLRQIPDDTSGGACEHDGDLFLYKDKDIYRVLGTGAPGWAGEAVQEPVEWMVESGDIGLTTPDAKYISRLDVRMSLAEGSEVSFFVKYDFEDEWYLLTTIVGTNLRSFDVPIRPKRCDTMRLRIEGIGDAKIYSLVKTIEQGGDVH